VPIGNPKISGWSWQGSAVSIQLKFFGFLIIPLKAER
jgi:hypothetical protein